MSRQSHVPLVARRSRPLSLKGAPLRSIVASFWAAQVVSSACLLPLGSAVGAAQTTASIPGEATCSNCRLVLHPIAAISDSSFAIDAFMTRVFRLRSGAFLVTGEGSSALGVYNANGRFVRSVGRRGGGAGEFGQINWVVEGPDARIWVFDHELRRVTILAPNTYSVVGTHEVPPINEVLNLGAAGFLASGSVAVGTSTSHPLHQLSTKGALVRSFGTVDSTFRRGFSERSLYRLLANGPDSKLLVAPVTEYRIELWSRALQRLLVLHRPVPWFPPNEIVGHPDFQRPPSIFRGVWSDSLGRIWTNVGVASRSWRPRSSANATGERPVVTQRDLARLYETRIEVLDYSNRKVFASFIVREALGTISGTPYHWILEEDPEGGTRIRIVELKVVQ